MESRTFYRGRGGCVSRALDSESTTGKSALPSFHTHFTPCALMPAGPTCVSSQACIIPALCLKAVKEPPQGPGAEAQSEGPMWECSSARDVHFAQLILKAQLCLQYTVHSLLQMCLHWNRRQEEVHGNGLSRDSVKIGSQRVFQALRGRGRGDRAFCSFQTSTRAALVLSITYE